MNTAHYLIHYIGPDGEAFNLPRGASLQDAVNNLKILLKVNDVIVLDHKGPLTHEELRREFERAYLEAEDAIIDDLIQLYDKFKGDSNVAWPVYENWHHGTPKVVFDDNWRNLTILMAKGAP